MPGPEDGSPLSGVAYERLLLGYGLRSADAALDVVASVTDTHFAVPAHQALWEGLRRLTEDGAAAGGAATIALLAAHLDRDSEPEGGWLSYLHSLYGDAALPQQIPTLVARLAEARNLRDLARVGQLLAGGAMQGDESATLVAAALNGLYTVADEATGAEVAPLADVVAGLDLTRPLSPVLASTGIPDLDERVTGGFRRGQYVVVAGRPAMGKSALALQMAADIAKQGVPVGYISLEMPAKDLATRFLARAARVDQGKLLLGKVTPDEVAKVERVKEAGSIPLAVSAPIDSTFAGVLAQMTSLRRRHGAQVVVIDYLGLVSEASGRNESRQDVIARMSRALKQYALRHDAVVIVVSQLNRALAGRADKRPQMTDLRESGSLEQDSDIIIMVHRPDVYDPEDRVGEAELIVEKSRLGTKGIADVVFQGAYGAFVPMARTPEPQRSAAGYGGVRDGAW